jgi:hypothetical protein
VRCITWPGITKPKYTQAEAFDSQASEVQRRVSGPERSNTLSTMTSLGLMYYREAKYAQAEALLKQVLEIQRRVLGLEHPSTVRSLPTWSLTTKRRATILQRMPLPELASQAVPVIRVS